jgi:hypothetical protein
MSASTRTAPSTWGASQIGAAFIAIALAIVLAVALAFVALKPSAPAADSGAGSGAGSGSSTGDHRRGYEQVTSGAVSGKSTGDLRRGYEQVTSGGVVTEAAPATRTVEHRRIYEPTSGIGAGPAVGSVSSTDEDRLGHDNR